MAKLHVTYTIGNHTVFVLCFHSTNLMACFYLVGEGAMTSITVVVVCNGNLVSTCYHYITVVSIRIWSENIGSS